MKRFKCKRFIGAINLALVSTIALYGATGLPTANAELFPGLDRELCMANAYLTKPGNSLPKDALNCTANDVEITEVLNPSLAECSEGEIIDFYADVKVRTNANERYDTTFYLPLTNQSPQSVSVDLTPEPNGLSFPYYCSLLLPKAEDAGFETTYADLDPGVLDTCADITKKWGSDTYTLVQQPISMLCIDEDGDNQADFHYCAAWDNQERENCTEDRDPVPGQIPNTKSKCNCDTLNIPIFIKPKPPVIVKSDPSPASHTEHGGTFDFTVNFTNPNDRTSLYIQSLTDEIDIDGDGIYDVSLNLWGAPVAVNPATDPEGVYLTATTCTQPVSDGVPAGEPDGEIGPSNPYGCSFSVTVIDRTLDTNPDIYDDVVRLDLIDKNFDAVVNGETCPLFFSPDPQNPVPGQYCTNVQQVSITNLAPSILVTKTATPDEVLEPGGVVTYTVEVTSTAGTYDDPLTITSLMDDMFGDLTNTTEIPDSTCSTGQDLFLAAPYTCTFSRFIGGDPDYEHFNKVTAKAEDNEGTEATNFDTALVVVKDVPSFIDLVKTAAAPSVDETGDDLTLFRPLDYTFTFTNTSTVDDVEFYKLEDQLIEPAGPVVDISDKCLVNGLRLDLNPVTLAPGASASCVITMQLQGNAGDLHTNKATVYGVDDDGVELTAMDPETVTFLNLPLQITPEVAMTAKVFVRLANSGVDDVTVKGFKLGNTDILNNEENGDGFIVFDDPPYSYDGAHGPFSFCGNLLEIASGDTEECAFMLRLLPGFDVQDISVIAKGLTVTVDDGDTGDSVIAITDISIVSDE